MIDTHNVNTVLTCARLWTYVLYHFSHYLFAFVRSQATQCPQPAHMWHDSKNRFENPLVTSVWCLQSENIFVFFLSSSFTFTVCDVFIHFQHDWYDIVALGWQRQKEVDRCCVHCSNDIQSHFTLCKLILNAIIKDRWLAKMSFRVTIYCTVFSQSNSIKIWFIQLNSIIYALIDKINLYNQLILAGIVDEIKWWN